MYPVGDPGGNTKDTGFSIAIWPAPNTSSLNEFRQHYVRCHLALVTITEKKGGQVISQKSHTVDSFGLTVEGKGSCNFIGLTRGMIAEVSRPTAQREAGINLYRTVIGRFNAI
ncbi:hypothetical protein BH09ACT8_BH09ACT8_22910 [soil metagenome]